MQPFDYYAPPIKPRYAERIAILTADNCHDLEFFYPYYRLVEEGFAVDVITPKGGKVQGKFGMPLQHSLMLSHVNPNEYSLLYIPGGKAPEALKKDEASLSFVREYVQTGKPVAAICHGAQVLAAAGVISGMRISAWPDVEKEIADAGGQYVNAEALVDGQFITGRWPADLPAHLQAVLQALGQSGGMSHARSAA